MGIRNSFPPLSKPHLPQNIDVQPFPLPVLSRPDIPVGGRLAHFVEQWEELTDNKWVLSIVRNGFKIPFKSVPSLSVVPIKPSQSSSPFYCEKKSQSFSRNGQWKGFGIWELPIFIPGYSCTEKERKVTTSSRPFLTKSVHKQTSFQDGDSQVSKTIDNGQRLGYLHRSDGCISSCSNTSNIQKIPLVHLQTSGLSVHGLTVRNVPKSVDFHANNECNSSTLMTTCRTSLPIPRRLANKRSDSQSTSLTQNTLFKQYKIWVSYQI